MTTKEPSHKRLLPPMAILALSLILATANLSIQPAMAQTTHDVIIFDFSFDPERRCIEYQDTLNWTNNDPVIHTLWFVFAENGTTYLLSDPIPPDQSWSHTFTEFAKFKLLYYSFGHLWVTGTLKIYIILGDVDGDGYVGSADAGVLAIAYGSWQGDPLYDEGADFDCDGYIGSADAGILSGNYGITAVP